MMHSCSATSIKMLQRLVFRADRCQQYREFLDTRGYARETETEVQEVFGVVVSRRPAAQRDGLES
jgi:hypothetical protein